MSQPEAPRSIVVNLPRPVVDHSGPVQLFFDWTRSVIVGSTQGNDLKERVLVHGMRVTVIPGIDDGSSAASSLPDSIEFSFYGEPLDLIGYVLLRSADDPGVDNDELIRDWLGCRMAKGMGDPARRYFLRQDLEALPAAMINWTDDQLREHVSKHDPGDVRRTLELKYWTDERLETSNRFNSGIGTLLHRRLAARSGALTPGRVPQQFGTDQLEALEFITNMFDSALRGSGYTTPTEIGPVHESFAAGRLRDGCTIRADRFVAEGQVVSCDANSAFVLYYAELGLGMVELDLDTLPRADRARGARLSDFWAPRLNSLVRMQRIYLARFPQNDPACFERYGPGEIIIDDNNEMVKDIVAAGDDPSTLERFMREHAKHVARSGGKRCFR